MPWPKGPPKTGPTPEWRTRFPFSPARRFGTLPAMRITIDGPAGSGKSTAARRLAQRLDIPYLDTGAMYRAVTLQGLREGIDLSDPDALTAVARRADIRLVPRPEGVQVLLGGEDVSRAIRTAEISDNAHHAANCPGVRAVMVELQQRIGAELGDFVTEGRDQGSVVFPAAELKFYLDADPTVRAERRYEELTRAGERVEFQDLLESILIRDRRDRSRAVGPLVSPQGAIEIDTTHMTVEQTTERLLEIVKERL